jgi:hypothetical protein
VDAPVPEAQIASAPTSQHDDWTAEFDADEGKQS